MINKGNGLGRETVKEIFKTFKCDLISGEAISTAIMFWESVGVDFEWQDDEEREYALDSSGVYYFELSKQNFK